jgi:hypothetical protein
MTVTENATLHSEGLNAKKRKHQEQEIDDEESCSEDELQTLHVVVRRVGKSERESLVVELDSDASVLDLKEKIAEALEEQDEIIVPTERQRLIFSGKMLRDDTKLLEEDLNMKAGDDQKYFVHLSPLPKGAAPSARTERELSENPLSPREETLQRVRARQQRRRRRQDTERGMSDPAAYHPYALDLTSGSLLPAAGRASAAGNPFGFAVGGRTEEALFSVTAAAEQSRLVQEVARRTLLPEAVGLGQPVTNLLDAATRGSAAAAAAASLGSSAAANPFCPWGGQADVAASILESALLGGRSAPANSAVSMLRYANPQLLQGPSVAGMNPTAAALQELLGGGRPSHPAETNPAVAALQDMLGGQPQSHASLHALLGRPQQPQTNTIQLLEDIATNAGELATTLRLLAPGRNTAASLVASSVTSPLGQAPIAATNTPHDFATRLALEQSLAGLSAASFLPGSLPPFF